MTHKQTRAWKTCRHFEGPILNKVASSGRAALSSVFINK